MRYFKFLIFLFPFLFYLLQTSFPFHLHLFYYTPNLLLSFYLALLFFSRGRSSLILLIETIICFFLSNSFSIFFNFILLAVLAGYIFLLKRYYKFDKLSLISVFAISSLVIFSEFLLIVFSLWQDLLPSSDIFLYLLKIGWFDILLNFLLIHFFLILGNIFLNNHQPRLVVVK